MRIFEESEATAGNSSGKAGTPSIPFGRGYYQSGYNNGACGVAFTPSGEPSFKTYKSMKHSKKKLKKMKRFNEDACATMGNTGGMGAVVSAQPSATPGDVAGGTKGSGDVGQVLGTYMKPGLKGLKKKKNKLKKFNEYNEIDNFTSRYYDNFDDEEETANELELQIFNSNNKRIQMFEDFSRKVTYECSGSPSPYFITKADFFAAMQECGYTHTTLTKKTDMLIVAQEDLGTLKCKKAEKYGIPVYTYAYAKKEMKNLKELAAKFNL